MGLFIVGKLGLERITLDHQCQKDVVLPFVDFPILGRLLRQIADRDGARRIGPVNGLEGEAKLGQIILGAVAIGELRPGTGEQVEMAAIGIGIEGDFDVLLEFGKGRIYRLGQRRENRKIGQRGQQASGEDDRFSADLVGQPAEQEEKRRADDQSVIIMS